MTGTAVTATATATVAIPNEQQGGGWQGVGGSPVDGAPLATFKFTN